MQAFAEMNKRPVVIYSPNSVYVDVNGDLKVIEQYVKGEQYMHPPYSQPPFYFSHTMGNHYELLTIKPGAIMA